MALPTRDYRVWRNLAAARYWAPGERDKTAEACRTATEFGAEERKIDPHNPRLLVDLADCAAMMGERGTAKGLLAEALALGREGRHHHPSGGGSLRADRGSRGRAPLARGGSPRGYPRDQIEKDPWLAALRSDSRYVRSSRANA